MKKTIALLIFACTFFSCKKEDSTPNSPAAVVEAVSDYYPLKLGNYWVYQLYEADTSLNFTEVNTLDSVWVEGDTTINGSIYSKIRSSMWGLLDVLRDSGDYLVDGNGRRRFSIRQTSDPIFQFYAPTGDSLYFNSAKMKGSDSTCIVPAGIFYAKYVVGTIAFLAEGPDWIKKRNYFYAYVSHVGLVSRRLIADSVPRYLEERLLRYSIK